MSSTGTPPLSPFIRGTTDTIDVYYLAAPTRRLIPDPQTLVFMLAGQAVRVLADADLVALPLGPPLPSRKDGFLVTQKYAAPPPAVIAYFLANGQRRRILDNETLAGLVARGLQIIPVELADLSAIPEGPPLPTRRDGTLYQGVGNVFAYLIQGGEKQAFPDATTLRDSGRDVTALLPIMEADLGFIPDGTPFPSKSKFLSSPAARIPLVLLPVRLETRIETENQSSVLWLRIYPDDIHVNSFEPELTVEEQAARTGYLALPIEATKAGFAALAQQFGPQRAAWIASDHPPATTKSADWTIAPFTNVLPERWIVMGYQGNDAGQVLATGPVIQDSLALGPVPNGSGPLSDDGSKWVRDFDRAVQVGMGFRITLTAAQQRGFDRLVVLGLRTNLSPADSAARLASLLEAHHYTDGLELMKHNTPTNNTEDVSSGLATKDPDFAQLFALEQGPPLCPSRPTADGDRVARVLSIPPQTFAHVGGSDGAQDEQARAMNTVLWPATWGYYLGQIINGAVANPDVILPAARDHFAAHVRARGHLPHLRIGGQPYGMLPVCWSAHWKPLEGGAFVAPLNDLLRQLRVIWAKVGLSVPRIPGAGDPEAALVDLLGITPSSTSLIARGVIGPEYNFAFWNFLQIELDKSWWNALTQSTLVDNSGLAAAMANTRLASATYVTSHRPLSDVFVAPDPLDGLPAPDFLTGKGAATPNQPGLASMGWQALRDATPPADPVPILFLLLRHAALREYLDTALDMLIAADAAQPSERIEAEMVGFTGIPLRPTAWDLLERVLPGRGAVGAVLDSSKSDATLPSFVSFWKELGQLAQYSAEHLDAAAREVLDLASYRLDSWITSLAHLRLDQARAADPTGGIVLGAYGWIENVGTQPEPPSAGYVHAPSLNQSATAAILRSGYLTHQGGAERPFAIDLSSARVRRALHLLDGIREGQSLGALLGYRLERTLNDTKQPLLIALIDTLRTKFPMPPPNQLDVVDGLALLRQYSSNQAHFWDLIGLAATSSPQGTGIAAAVATLADAVDSLADLTLAESVHQLVRGNTLRAGATLDTIARGDAPPPEIEFIKTPRSGTAQTFRLMTVAIGDTAPGWTVTPRAQGEPRLNAWASALMGDPSLIRIRTRFVDAGGSSLASEEIALQQLGLAPIDLLSFPETQGIGGELADRIRRVVCQARPAAVPVTASLEIIGDRDPAWSPQTVGLTEWLGLLQAMSRMLSGARAVEPRDLVAQNDAPGSVDTRELQSRADTAESQLRAVLTALQNPTAPDVILLSAAAFGIASVPALDPLAWPAQTAAASVEVSARVQSLNRLATGFVRDTAHPDALRDHDIARLQTVFGSSFLVLPALASSLSAAWPELWSNSTALQSGDNYASIRWMQQASRVRASVGRMNTAVMFAEALAGHPLLQLQVAQLPLAADPAADRWVALNAPPQSSPTSRLSLVAFSPTPFAAGASIAGIMIDEWIEVWPSADQITGVSFQYSDPVARAPQSILLAVQPDDFPEWTFEALEGSVLEAFDLAKIRGVDPDLLLGTIPPQPIAVNVKAFQSISDTLIFVLDTAGSLWLRHAPFDAISPVQEQVDANVSAFEALSDLEVVVLGTDGRLWLEHGPFGNVPPQRQQIDAGQPTLPPPVIIIKPPAMTIVPDVSSPGDDISPDAAKASLKAAGLTWKFLGILQPPCKAWHQDVPAGNSVPLGTLVTVSFEKGPVNRQ